MEIIVADNHIIQLRLYTVELPNNGHIESRPFVLYMEVVPLHNNICVIIIIIKSTAIYIAS